MSLELVLSESRLEHLNHPATEKLRSAVAQYASDLVTEASRLEAAANAGAGSPQITSAMIRDAEILLRQRLIRPRQHWMLRTLKLVSAVSGIVTGVMADKDYLNDQTHLVLFVVAVAVTVASTVVVLMKE